MDSTLKLVSLGVGCALSGLIAGYLLTKQKEICYSSDHDILIQKTYEKLPHLDRRIDEYVLRNSSHEPLGLVQLREMTLKKYPGEPMIIDPIEAQLFQVLLKMMDGKKCVEVGGFTGYNAASMALAIPEGGTVIVCDITDEYIKSGRSFIEKLGPNVWSKLDIHIRPAFETMDDFIKKGEEFDFIFLDAEWINCMMYYERALELVRKGGIIAIDNTLCSGRVVHHLNTIKDDELREEVQALDEMNAFIRTDDRVQMVFLKIADGVTICRKI